MNPNWGQFLGQYGAKISNGIVQHFGDSTAELRATAESTVLCDLHQFGTLRISGDESQSFLQNLLSNDIREVNTAHAQLSSLNNATGRMLTNFLVWQVGEDYLLQLPHSLIEIIRKKLSMYVLRTKVKITDASHGLIVIGVAGSNAENILKDLFDKLPLAYFSNLAHKSGCIIKISDTRFQISTTPDQAEALWSAISLKAKPVGSICWDWLNIRACMPIILPPTQEQFVAQMVNFDIIGGVNFKKGCYPGQEIVARMHYLGKLKQRMYLAHIDTIDLPQAGDKLFSADMGGQASGMIANASPAPSGGFDVLAVVQINSRKTQTVHWKSSQGEPLKFLPPPYPLPDF